MEIRTPEIHVPESPGKGRAVSFARLAFGLALFASVVVLAALGPIVAPENPAAVVGSSFAPPAPGTTSSAAPSSTPTS
ncbi:MAG: hypothetical protein H0U65_00590 [Rubrobacter sp.]|nr:hypothetical protein [Rubrobacter sp.]